MKVKCIHYGEVQDKYDNKKFYEPNKEYEVEEERGKELIASGYFELVETKEEVKEEKPKKAVKKSAK